MSSLKEDDKLIKCVRSTGTLSKAAAHVKAGGGPRVARLQHNLRPDQHDLSQTMCR